MISTKDDHVDYENPVMVAEGIYWVGFYDNQSGLHCNPFDKRQTKFITDGTGSSALCP